MKMILKRSFDVDLYTTAGTKFKIRYGVASNTGHGYDFIIIIIIIIFMLQDGKTGEEGNI